jgi:hypothetical protein
MFVWATRMGFISLPFLLLELFSTLRPRPIASFSFHLLLSNWPTASPKSTSVRVRWFSFGKAKKILKKRREEKEEKTLP